MKILFEFGFPGIKREANWWRPFEDIPHLLRFQGTIWSAIAYNTGTGQIDWHYIFGKHHEQTAWGVANFEDVFNVPALKCECGAIYTGAPEHHMFYCPKWTS